MVSNSKNSDAGNSDMLKRCCRLCNLIRKEYAEVAKIYSKNKSFHEIMKQEKESVLILLADPKLQSYSHLKSGI